MSDLNQEDLQVLRGKLPRGYIKRVQNEYVKQNSSPISGRSVQAFMAGDSYTPELHQAVLAVAEAQQVLLNRTKALHDKH